MKLETAGETTSIRPNGDSNSGITRCLVLQGKSPTLFRDSLVALAGTELAQCEGAEFSVNVVDPHGDAIDTRLIMLNNPKSYIPDYDSLQKFGDVFWEKVGEVNLDQHIVLAPYMAKPPRNINQFSLAPIIPEALDDTLRSPYPTTLRTRRSVRYEYGGPSGKPFLDAQLGVGLVHQGALIAVCSGGLTQDGALIVQLQDVSSDRHGSGPADGLRSGFDWKATLIHAWRHSVNMTANEVFGLSSGRQYVLRSAINNPWITKKSSDATTSIIVRVGNTAINLGRFMRLVGTYDRTAEKMSLAQTDERGDYLLSELGTDCS